MLSWYQVNMLPGGGGFAGLYSEIGNVAMFLLLLLLAATITQDVEAKPAVAAHAA